MNKKLLAILVLGLAVPAIALAAEPAVAQGCCASMCQMCCAIFGHCPLCP